MTHSVDNRPVPEWVYESDWLVDIVMFDRDYPEDNDESLDYIGRLFAFAGATNTRFLAQIDGTEQSMYELWFSFISDAEKQKFLQMVRDDGYANPDEETTLSPAPSLMDLPDLRPLTQVFPEQHMEHILAVAVLTSASIGASNHVLVK